MEIEQTIAIQILCYFAQIVIHKRRLGDGRSDLFTRPQNFDNVSRRNLLGSRQNRPTSLRRTQIVMVLVKPMSSDASFVSKLMKFRQRFVGYHVAITLPVVLSQSVNVNHKVGSSGGTRTHNGFRPPILSRVDIPILLHCHNSYNYIHFYSTVNIFISI